MRGYVVLSGDLERDWVRSLLGSAGRASGWSRVPAPTGLAILVRGPCPPPVGVGPTGALVVIGDVFDSFGDPAGLSTDGVGLTDDQMFRRMSREVWGRYVALARTQDGWSLFRDPSGALDAFAWRGGGLTVFANDLPSWLEPTLPQDLDIDQRRLALMLAAPTGLVGGSALKGVLALSPGEMASRGAIRPVWSPAQVIDRGFRGEDEAAPILEKSVSLATSTLAAGPSKTLVEISGGLDSAIVAGSLPAADRADIAAWLNLYIDEPLADERCYAQAVAAQLGVDLTVIEKGEGRFRPRRSWAGRRALRPAVGAQDSVYDQLIGELAQALGAERLLSGQGGDTVFMQVAPPGLSRDLLIHRGMRGLLGPALVDLARWTRRSVWSQAREAFRPPGPARADAFRPMAFAGDAIQALTDGAWPHPWLGEAEALSSPKRFQVQGLALMQRLVGPSLRARHVDCVFPLLAQPVVEASLRTVSVDLVRGGRDRGLARDVFADRIPEAIRLRKTKGDGTGYFSRMIERSLPALRDLLLGGELAALDLLDRARLEAMLTPDYLVVEGLYPEFLDAAIIELWVREWRGWMGQRRAATRQAAAS